MKLTSDEKRIALQEALQNKIEKQEKEIRDYLSEVKKIKGVEKGGCIYCGSLKIKNIGEQEWVSEEENNNLVFNIYETLECHGCGKKTICIS